MEEGIDGLGGWFGVLESVSLVSGSAWLRLRGRIVSVAGEVFFVMQGSFRMKPAEMGPSFVRLG